MGRSPYLTKCTKYVAYLLVLFGLLTALAPAVLINNVITSLFFDAVPRWLFGLMQTVVGLVMLIPGSRLRLVRNLAGGAMFALWAWIIARSYILHGEPTNIVVVVHFLFWAWRVVADSYSSLYRDTKLESDIQHSEEDTPN